MANKKTNKPTKLILLIEDEPSQRNALQEKLERSGYSILTATNGEEGLAMAMKEHPDLILLDVIMPKMDGLTMLKELRKDTWGSNAKVIFLTNLSNGETTAQVEDKQISEYLVKTNWSLNDIVKKIETILS